MALPELPQVPLDQMLPLDPAELLSDQVATAIGQAGSGIGGVGGAGSGGTGSGMSFFGIRDKGQSVVIMIDVSDSMFGRTGDLDYATRKLVRRGQEQSFQQVRNEAMAMIVRGFVEPIARELPMEYALELNRLIELQMEGSVG
jgi:hypothetical protein